MSKIGEKIPIGIRRIFDPLDLTHKAVQAYEKILAPPTPQPAAATVASEAEPPAPAPAPAQTTAKAAESGPAKGAPRRRRGGRAGTVLTDEGLGG